MYRPAIAHAETLQVIHLPGYTAVLLGNADAIGSIEYGCVLQVIENRTQASCYYVAAEVNEMNAILGGGSHFMCAYDGGQHLNYGCSDDWADQDKFLSRAIEMTKEKFGIEDD